MGTQLCMKRQDVMFGHTERLFIMVMHGYRRGNRGKKQRAMNWGQIIYLGFIGVGLGVIEIRSARVHLERRRAQVFEAWQELDLCLRDRLKAIPPLMNTIETHARSRNEGLSWFEGFSSTLTISCRRAEEKITEPRERASRENDVTRQLRAVMQFTNTFPDLIINPDFREGQRALTVISHRIIEAQRYYNQLVNDFDARLKRAHYPLIAMMYRIRPMLPVNIDDVSLWFDEAREDLYLHIPRI